MRFFICLSSRFSVHHTKKQTCSIEGRWRRRRERKRGIFRAGSRLRRAAALRAVRTLHEKNWPPFVSFSPSLACLRLPLAPRCNLSRHTLGWRPTAAAQNPAGPRSASVPRRRRGGKKMKKGEKACRSSRPLSSDGCVNRPTAASAPPQPRQWSNGGRAEGASRIECSHFRSCVKNSHHSVATVTSEESSSNGTGGLGNVYPRGGICAGCCCHGNAAFSPPRCCLDLRML